MKTFYGRADERAKSIKPITERPPELNRKQISKAKSKEEETINGIKRHDEKCNG